MLKHDNLKLDHQLCFALYAATHAVTRAYRCGLEGAGITYTQYLVMIVLWESGHMPVGKIAERLALDSATLTPLLKKLESVGLVTRVRNKIDERVVEIKLTEAGEHMQHEIAEVQKDVSLKTGLTNEEFAYLRRTLHSLAAKINTAQSL